MKTLFIFSVFSAFTTIILGGNLDPPGPPHPTMKTLDEVEPRIPIGPETTEGDTDYEYIISNPGSYYLTGNITTTKGGIKIKSDEVTLDLCGFSLVGPGSGTGTRNYGIYIGDSGIGWAVSKNNVEIRNGIVRNFGEYGIYAPVISSTNHRLLELRIISNGSDGTYSGGGIYLAGDGHLIEDCTVRNNGAGSTVDVNGIYAYGDGDNTVINCTVNDNGYQVIGSDSEVSGIYVGSASKVVGNTVRRNGSFADGDVYGIRVFGGGCTVTGNIAYNNGTAANKWVYGIYTSAGNSVADNSAHLNGSEAEGQVFGIYTNSGCMIAENTAYKNGVTAKDYVYGIRAGHGSTVTGNSAHDNGNSSTGSYVRGIYANEGCTVIRNTAYQNGLSASGTVTGIQLVGNSVVDQNTAYDNNGTNMVVPGSCTVGINHAP